MNAKRPGRGKDQQTRPGSTTAPIVPQATDNPPLITADEALARVTKNALANALALAAQEVFVFPVGLRNPRREDDGWKFDKHYRVKWGTEASTEPDAITKMFAKHPGAAVGIATGPSRLVVLDQDDLTVVLPKHPETFSYTTMRGGRHHYYRAPDGMLVKNGGSPLKDATDAALKYPKTDVKAFGGMVVYYGPEIKGDEFDALPVSPAWLNAPWSGKPTGARVSGANAAAENWREQLKTLPRGKACTLAQGYLYDIEKMDEADHIGHITAYDLAYRGFRLALEGHKGVPKIIRNLSDRLAAYLDVERPGIAETELEAAFNHAAAVAVAEGVSDECDCQPLTTIKRPDAERSGPGGFDIFLAEDVSPMDAKMGALVETLRARGDIELQQMLDGQVAIRNSSGGWSMAVDLYRVHYCRVKGGGSKWLGKFDEAIRTLDPPLVAKKDAEPKADEQLFGRRGSVTWASDIRMIRTRWLWEGRLPMGELALGGGREGTGKSTYAAWLVAQVTRGTLPGEMKGVPRRVLYVGTEDKWETTIAPRMVAAGADMSMIGRFDMTFTEKGTGEVSDEVAVLPEDLDEFRRVILEEEIALVVLDPLLDLVNIGLDTHKERDVRHALRPLVAVAHATEAAFYGLVHFNKGTGDVASLITGSGAFKNVARLVDAFAADTNDGDGERVMQQVKNSLGPLLGESLGYRIVGAEVQTEDGINRTSRFEFTGTAGRSVMEILDANRRAPSDSDGPSEAAAWLRAYLTARGFTAPAGEVLAAGKEEADFSPAQLRRAQDRIPGYLVATRRVSDGASGAGHWIWELKESAT